MPYLLAILIGYFSIHSSHSPSSIPPDCQRFKTGTFESWKDGAPTGTIIRRTRRFQYEKGPEGEKTKDKVTWLDDCTYQLSQVYYKTEEGKIDFPDVIVSMVETGEDFYRMEAKIAGKEGYIYQGELRRIKK